MKFVYVCLVFVFLACTREVTVPVEQPCQCPPAPVAVAPEPPPKPEPVAADTAVTPIEEPLQITVTSARYVPTDPNEPAIPVKVMNAPEVVKRAECTAALAAPAATPLAWQQEFQNGISSSKLVEGQFLAIEKLHRECAHLLVGPALTELQLRYARALYALATVPDYPFGFPYSESFRHTTVDQLAKFLSESGLAPNQVQPELTGTALAELRRRSFRELYQIYQDRTGKYTEARIRDATIGLCTEIRKGARAQTETGLADTEIQQVDCE